MGRRASAPTPPVQSDLHIRLSISLSDGSFDTHVKVPLRYTSEQRDAAVRRWLGLASTAMQMGVDNLHATLQEDPTND